MARDLKLKVTLSALDRASRPMRTVMGGSIGLARSLKQTRDSLKGLQTQQRDISSFRTLGNATKQTGNQLKTSQDRVRALSRELGNTRNPTKALNTEFRRAVREAQGLKTKHQEQQRELQGLRGRLNDAGISTRNLGEHERRLRGEIGSANAALGKQEAALRRVTQQQQRLQRAKDKFQKTQQLAGSMASSGAAGLAAGGGALYAGARFMAPGLEFDASMSKVQSRARLNKSSPEYKALREQARALGASTQFTAGEAASAQGFLAQAGFNPQAIQGAMPGMLDLAKAGDSELGQTADIASNILSGFGIDPTEMGRVGDVLVGTFNRSNTDLQMLGETMKYASTISLSLGQDLETVAAMAGKLGDAGIQGGMGGTALRSIMNRLSAPPKMAATAMEELGINAQDAVGNMRQMPDILQELYNKTRQMGNAQRAGYFKAIAGEEAVSGLSYLVNQAGSGELQGFIATLRRAEGEASQTARTMADNLRGDLDGLNSAWEDLGIQVMETQDGGLRSVTQGLTKVIGKVKAWTVANPELTQQLIKGAAILATTVAVMGGLTIALASIIGPFAILRYGLTVLGIKGAGLGSMFRGLGGALLTVGKTAAPAAASGLKALAVGVIPKLTGAFAGLGAVIAATPIGWLLAAGAAVVAVGLLVYKYWNPIKGFMAGVWDGLRSTIIPALKALGQSVSSAFGAVGKLFEALSTLPIIGAIFKKTWAFISPMWDGLAFGAKAVFHWVSALLTPVQDTTGAARNMGTAFGEAIGSALALFTKIPKAFFDMGGAMISGLANGIKAGMGFLKSAIDGIGDGAIGWFKQKLGIRSPSRVFAALGDDTMAGLKVGIDRSQRGPLSAVLNAGQAMAKAGALALGIGAAGQAVAVDSRPALQASQAPMIVQGDTYHIQISASPGTDTAQLKQMLSQLLDERSQAKAARVRSAFYDNE